MWVWKILDPTSRKRIPYVCNSWRCQYCRKYVAQKLFARTRAGFEAALDRNVALRATLPELTEQRARLKAKIRRLRRTLPAARESVERLRCNVAVWRRVLSTVAPSESRDARDALERARRELTQARMFRDGTKENLKNYRKELDRTRRLVKRAAAVPDRGREPKLWRGLVYLCLTFPPTFHELARADLAAAYKELGPQMEAAMKRIRRWQRSCGMLPLGNEWIQTIEAHGSGVPHINLFLYSPEWAKRLRERKKLLLAEGLTHKESIQLYGGLFDALTGIGFGERSTAEACRPGMADRLIGYGTTTAKKTKRITPLFRGDERERAAAAAAEVTARETWDRKLSGELNEADRLVAEFVKNSQLPVHAPLNFHRHRTGKDFLPPIFRDETVTGTIVRRSTRFGRDEIAPVVQSENAEYMARVYECCQREQQLATAELRAGQTSKPEAAIVAEAIELARVLASGRLPDQRAKLVTTHYFGRAPPEPLWRADTS